MKPSRIIHPQGKTPVNVNEVQGYPAYGRKYNTVQAMIDDWNKGKDFQLSVFNGGQYFSIRSIPILKRDGFNQVILKQGSMIRVITLTETH